MPDISPERRAILTAKWPDIVAPRPPDPALDATVQAILDSEQIVDRQGWGRRIGAWVDPVHNPRMYDIVTKAHGELRAAMAAGKIGYNDYGSTYDPDDPADTAVLIHFVGTHDVAVCRRPQPGRGGERGVPYHTGLLQLYAQVYDRTRDCDCQIHFADDCGQGRYVGGQTNMMVLAFGAFILVFRCCESCDLAARQTAEVGYKLAIMEAYER